MPKYRFTAVDTEGMFRDGTIDAPDGQAARDRLAANGLKVRELEEVDSPGEPPLFTTPPVIPVAAGGRRSEGEPSAYSRSKAAAGSSKGTAFFAVAAILLTVASVGYSFYKNPPWGRLSKYDFSSPEAALRSNLKLEANGDILAAVEYEAKIDRRKRKEYRDTLEVKRTEDADGKKLIFIQYRETNPSTKKTRQLYDVRWFERNEDTGYWTPSTPSRNVPEKLSQDIIEWTGKSER